MKANELGFIIRLPAKSRLPYASSRHRRWRYPVPVSCTPVVVHNGNHVHGKGVTRHGRTDLPLVACFMSAHDEHTAGVAINLARTHARRVLQEVKKTT